MAVLLALSSPQGAPPAASAEVLAPVERLLKGVADHDAGVVDREVRPEGFVFAVAENADGTSSLQRKTWQEIAKEYFAPTPDRYEEKLTDISVSVEGASAVVWSPFAFSINGKVVQCGINNFGLVREDNQWKILTLIVTERTNCG
ncbi:MAG: hypothetical protein QM605_09180 [Sphingobium sp.]